MSRYSQLRGFLHRTGARLVPFGRHWRCSLGSVAACAPTAPAAVATLREALAGTATRVPISPARWFTRR